MGATLAGKMAEWVHSFELGMMGREEVEELKKRFIDSVGVALGALDEEPVRIARSIASITGGSGLLATLWGFRLRATADHAAFHNGVAVRYFDFNDTYLAKEALHPSDTIPALVAAAEIVDAGGEKLLEGMAVAYEVAGALADAYSVRGKGWDHVVYIGIASAAGVSKVLGLNRDEIEQAINIAVNTSPALRQTRAGELSMWKGCAAAHAARNGLFSALLAWKGMTGPSPVFEGEFGFFKVALGGDTFELRGLGGQPLRLKRTSIKYWPVEYHSMSAVDAALRIRERSGPLKPEDISEVTVKTFTVSYKIIAKDPEKWDPKTRETADHSLPYIVSAALIDGKVWVDTFSEERIRAADTRKVMSRMRVLVDPEYDKIYPEGIPNRVIVRLRDGSVYEEEVVYPPGHYRNPLDREAVEEKFLKLVGGRVDGSRARDFLEDSWRLEKVRDVGNLLRRLVVQG